MDLSVTAGRLPLFVHNACCLAASKKLLLLPAPKSVSSTCLPFVRWSGLMMIFVFIMHLRTTTMMFASAILSAVCALPLENVHSGAIVESTQGEHPTERLKVVVSD
ncbi:hypothetical protein F5878DRAFT_647475, partial [Lentinula raphanica]